MVRRGLFFLWSLALFSSLGSLQAGELKAADAGPLHEAFVTPIMGSPILEAVSFLPPKTLQENPPSAPAIGLVWIPGYWGWDNQIEDFIWVTGVWRKPPPGMNWISGFWDQSEVGHVWIRGFWYKSVPEKLSYTDLPPPDPLDEKVAQSETNQEFWAPGFWEYSPLQGRYSWVKGSLQAFDRDWVYIPATYVWRPGGYIFIPPYWDYPLVDRGVAYSPLFIEPSKRMGYVVNPSITLEPDSILRRLFPTCPNYITLFQHSFHFSREFWHDFAFVPTWWYWASWWSLTWHDQWGLYWWYSHPGFPQPLWVTEQISQQISPPLDAFCNLVSRVPPPFFITPNGMTHASKILMFLRGDPIMPADPKQAAAIRQKVEPHPEEAKILRPLAIRMPASHTVNREIAKPRTQFYAEEKATEEPMHSNSPKKPTKKEAQEIPSKQGSYPPGPKGSTGILELMRPVPRTSSKK